MLKDEINEKPQTQTTEYKFITSDISDFVNELQTPKQEFPNSENIYDSLPEPEIEDTAKETLHANQKVAQSTAHLIVTTIDAVIPETMAFAAKQKDSDFFKADPATKSELEDAFTEYIKLKGAKDLPPSVMIIILLLVAYGTKIPAMLQMRKAALLEEQNKKLRRENEDLKRRMGKNE
jgi:HPt (histidine-containing phosphotransfer) domain-containing protein